MNKIAIIDIGYKDYQYEADLFHRYNYELKLYNGNPVDNHQKAIFAGDAVGLLVRGTPIDSKFLDLTPDLRAIVRYGVGYDNIDVDDATRRRIKVANVQGYANHAVSDHALALIFSLIRSLPSGSTRIREIFSKPPVENILELHDKTLGIIGLGRIGSCLASKAKTLFKEVLACDPYIPDEKFESVGAKKTDLFNLLNESHVISIHCNLTPETRHLINDEVFSQMKKKPVVVNTSRGPVVCQDSLINALNTGLIHSTGIDVFEDEPPTQRQEPLFTHPRVIVTGHYAWYSESSIITLQRRAADNMIGLLEEQNVEDKLNAIW
jgi:D-3-phosphoglycerate dehydrogenase / 2-oxoglutarate reductase